MHVIISDEVNHYSIYNNFVCRDWFIDLLTIPFWYFILIILESTVIQTLKKRKHIWIFVFQGMLMLFYTFMVLKLLPYNIITSSPQLTPVYYMMLLYFISGIIINFLIAGSISDSKKNRIILWFDKLSLLDKQTIRN